MSDSGGGDKPKVGLIKGGIAAAIICLFVVGWGLLQAADYERQADNKRAEYSEYTNEKVSQACIRITPAERTRCVNEAFEAKREYEANQHDLEAQRKSALWAFIMGAAAVIGMALSAVGVWLVKTTFDETRKSNKIAIAGDRAWLHFEPVENGIISIGFDDIEAEIRFEIRNYGNRPALNVTVSAMVLLDESPPKDLHELIGDSRMRPSGIEDIRSIFPTKSGHLSLTLEHKFTGLKSAKMCLVVWVPYRDPGIKETLHGIRAFDVHVRDANMVTGTNGKLKFHGHQNSSYRGKFTLTEWRGVASIST